MIKLRWFFVKANHTDALPHIRSNRYDDEILLAKILIDRVNINNGGRSNFPTRRHCEPKTALELRFFTFASLWRILRLVSTVGVEIRPFECCLIERNLMGNPTRLEKDGIISTVGEYNNSYCVSLSSFWLCSVVIYLFFIFSASHPTDGSVFSQEILFVNFSHHCIGGIWQGCVTILRLNPNLNLKYSSKCMQII